ncbi:PAN2-PAN3 deadenylation complex subunit pan3-like isoform X2 [Gigantopelta aegis]|uniref:PAN2-PAN3 deadenylation complex subunit pan3-like isoform X2 n=1 Tax=Gigantopelta aegis TaxID=1735272 RepID=UPI001B88E752|nr:PAN2-PAN3 deadenylation complex subunit pan3-like isoform X2 [Gigantopelta aegis]
MANAVPPGKKPALCRYFLSSGSCIYGDECQFLHQSHGLQNSFANGPTTVNEKQGEALPNNGDQYFNATFNAVGPMPDFQPLSVAGKRPRPRSRNSILGPLSQNSKLYSTPGPPVVDQNMANDFAALTLAGAPVPGKLSNPAADLVKQAASLSHSSSTPSFSSFSSVYNSSNMPSSIQSSAHITNTNPVYSHASPNHSPGISPSGSPLMLRRTSSPATPHRQTTVPQKDSDGNGGTVQENVGGTTYFYHPDDFNPQYEGVQLPNFSVYPGVPPHIAHMKVKVNMPQFFMPDELKMDVLSKHSLSLAQIDHSQNPDIPAEMDHYNNLFPLEPPTSMIQKSNTFHYPTMCYKAVNTKDGLTYCIRRIQGYRLANTKCMPLIDMWRKMYHPNIVQLREVFTTKAFGDSSIVFVYDYHPGAETLMSRHFLHPAQVNGFNPETNSRQNSVNKGMANSAVSSSNPHSELLPESLIWTYVVQLSSALRAIHAAGLAYRILEPSKILIYNKSRVRLNSVGIIDVLTFDNSKTNPLAVMQHYQQEDLVALGKVCLALACNSVLSVQRDQLSAAMDLITRNYSPDLKNLILYLLTNQNRPRSINDVMPMIGARFFTQLDAAQLRSDVLENELGKEVENGRLLRLLCKLGSVNERPEFNMDQSWTETGDRYILKLFRDYLFHQVDENGAPWIDMAHIVQCMNKVDAGVPEKICLMSRDEQVVLVVSYAEIKRCFQSAFSELLNVAHQANFS